MNKENVITLDNPVKRGEQVIEQVTLMKPNAGTLRGVSLAAVANSELGAVTFPKNLSVDDLMADVAVIFHWPPSELYPMSLTELITWREKALRRSGNTNE